MYTTKVKKIMKTTNEDNHVHVAQLTIHFQEDNLAYAGTNVIFGFAQVLALRFFGDFFKMQRSVAVQRNVWLVQQIFVFTWCRPNCLSYYFISFRITINKQAKKNKIVERMNICERDKD